MNNDRISEYGLTQSKEWVTEYPLTSVLIAYGLGLGIGVAIGTALSETAPVRDPGMAERYSKQLVEAMRYLLPSSVSDRISI